MEEEGKPTPAVPFKKQSCFFKYLSYWKELDTPHAIDCMHLEKNVSVFFPRGVTPTSKSVCVLPFPDGDAKRHKDLSWFRQEKALRPAGEGEFVLFCT